MSSLLAEMQHMALKGSHVWEETGEEEGRGTPICSLMVRMRVRRQ